jgi:hypothetical protein
MEIRATDLTAGDLRSLIDYAARVRGYVLTVDIEPVRETRNGATFRVKVDSETGAPGSRRSSSGRRGPWACWHAFRDVLQAVFDKYPDATVRTALATYRGAEGFARTFPGTADTPAGCGFTTSELCDCEDS